MLQERAACDGTGVASGETQLDELKSAALDAAGHAIVLTDKVGTILWVNRSFQELTGYSPEEAVGKSTRLLRSDTHPPAFYKCMWDTILSGRQWQGQMVNRRKDGTSYSEEMTITPIRSGGQEITHFVAVKLDITDRKRSEERLRMLAQAVGNSSELMAMTDAELKIVFANRALLQALRYAEETEVLGKSISSILSPHNPPQLQAEIASQTLQAGFWKGQCLHLRSDGTDYPVLLSTSVVKNRAGQVVGTLGIAQDISEQKRAEQEILFKTALLEAQTEATIDAILAVDEAKKIILWNQHFITMWGVSQAMMRARNDGQLLQFVTNQIENPQQFLDWVEYLYGHPEERSRDEIRLKDGRVLDRYSAPLVDSTNKYRGRIWYFRDITESKQAEDRLRVSEEQFRQLAENIREVFFIITPDPVRMSYISPAYDEIWGRSRQEVYDRPSAWMESVHPEDRERVTSLYSQSVEGVPIQMAYRVLRPEGAVRWIHARSFPVHNAEGQFTRVVGIAEDITARKEKETALDDAHQKLNEALQRAEQQASAGAKLTQLVDILQSCQTAGEAYEITANALQDTLRGTSGAVCITSPSRDIVEAVATWGSRLCTEKAFRPDECWALRRGRTHRVGDPSSPLRCAHVGSEHQQGYICVPLVAQGETLGILYLEASLAAAESPDKQRSEQMEDLEHQANSVGERISLALANIRLREVLRSQSIRDPLTGLFNRRFMEESLERELRRAMRGAQQVAFLMLDIDHFKRFNDTFGHQAGDALLCALANLLKQRTRGQDVACRFGGEEFACILTGASLEAARKRAEILRRDVSLLNVQYGAQQLGTVTLSTGIAVFPDCASNADTLLRAADDALYRAKHEGRDRIITAPTLASLDGSPEPTLLP